MSSRPHPQSAPLPRSQKPLKLREARFEDHPQIAALVSKFELHIENFAGWSHLWTNNPAFRDIKDKFAIGWVLTNSEGAISGYLGNVPVHYEFEGQRLLAATTRAWVVDTPYRTYSPLLLGTYFQQPNVDLFLSTTVNSQSAAAYSMFHGSPVPTGVWDRTLFWITHYQGFVESFLRNQRFARSSLRKRLCSFAKPLSYPLSTGVYLGDWLKGTRFPKQGQAVNVLPCSQFDDRFDEFWRAQRAKKYKQLLAVRTREVLDWHFKFALQRNAAWIYTIENQSGTAAYSIFLRYDYQPIGLTRIRLVDFQCLEPEEAPNFLAAVLQVAGDRCRRESIHMLELIGLAPDLEKKLEPASPRQRSLPNWLYFYKTNNSLLAEKLKHPSVWEPSLFDGDSSL
jgi:hypothetical protein